MFIHFSQLFFAALRKGLKENRESGEWSGYLSLASRRLRRHMKIRRRMATPALIPFPSYRISFI